MRQTLAPSRFLVNPEACEATEVVVGVPEPQTGKEPVQACRTHPDCPLSPSPPASSHAGVRS